ncbi:MAG: 30S ribosomal protein S6 [Oscillatoriales cyanobacterium SM2_1_8]|nr:30S ribosomal protein S6 [Oscillatoriales cyanobacterium SM2_1_8]
MPKRLYETMYILKPEFAEQVLDEAIGKYQAFLQEREAEEITVQHRGKRRLAYSLGKYREGIYIQMNYLAPAGTVEAMEKVMRIDENILRYLTMRTTAELLARAAETVEPPATERPRAEVPVRKPPEEVTLPVATVEA